MATRAEVETFARALANIRKLTVRDVERLFRSLNISDPKAAAAQLVADLPAIIGQYGELSAAVAADWYDDLRDAAGAPGSFRATMADPVPTAAVEANARWAVAPLFGTPGDMLGRLKQISDRMALQPGRDTIARNAARDRSAPRWARVPVGETCSFCLLTASRGAVYRSRETAGDGRRFHGECDCTPTPMWSGQDYPSGYDPDALYQSYQDARTEALGGNTSAVLSKLRELNDTN